MLNYDIEKGGYNMADYRLPMDADGVKYHGVVDGDGDNPGQVLYGVDEHGNYRPVKVDNNGNVLTRLTGSIIDYQDFSFTDLNENEREVIMLKPPENTYYKVISISFDIRPKKEMRLRIYLGESDLMKRFLDIRSGSNMLCFNNYLSVNFDDVIYGPKSEIEGLEVFKNIYGTHELPIYFSLENTDNMLEDGFKSIRVIYEVIR